MALWDTQISVKKISAKNGSWFHMVWSIFDAQHSILLPNQTLSSPFFVKQLLSSATFNLWSTKLGCKAFANTSGIRHSYHPWFCLGSPTLHNRFPKQCSLEKQWFPCPKDSWHLPGHGTHHFFILFAPEMQAFFPEKKLYEYKAETIYRTLNLSWETSVLHLFVPGLLSSVFGSNS